MVRPPAIPSPSASDSIVLYLLQSTWYGWNPTDVNGRQRRLRKIKEEIEYTGVCDVPYRVFHPSILLRLIGFH